MLIFLILCGVAAAETAQQTSLSALSQTSSICIDPPPQSGDSTLDTTIALALASLAAPSLSWQSFMRGSNLADKAVAVVRVRDAPGPPGGTVANGSSSAPNA